MKIADYILIAFLGIVSVLFLGLQFANNNSKDLAAIIRYGNQTIIAVDLNSTEKSNVLCQVESSKCPSVTTGLEFSSFTLEKKYFNNLVADMTIEYKIDAIRVAKESSPRKICSRQGWANSTNEMITCMPNSISIKLIPVDHLPRYINDGEFSQ